MFDDLSGLLCSFDTRAFRTRSVKREHLQDISSCANGAVFTPKFAILVCIKYLLGLLVPPKTVYQR